MNKNAIKKMKIWTEILESQTLKYKIIKKFFPQINENDIFKFQVFLPIALKPVDFDERIYFNNGVFFSRHIDVPCVYETQNKVNSDLHIFKES